MQYNYLLPTDCLDVAALRELSSKDMTQAILSNWSSWGEAAEKRITKLLSYSEYMVQPSSREEKFANPLNLSVALGNVNNRHTRMSAIVNIAIRHSSASCHSILFGQLYPVRLNEHIKKIVQCYTEADMEVRHKAYTKLLDDPLYCNNVLYTLKTRMDECYSYSSSSYLSTFGITFLQGHARRSIKKYLENSVPAVIRSRDIGKDKMSVLVYVIYYACISQNLSVDYFLLQDYSNYAVFDDTRPLTAQEKQFLSAYLSATPEARDRVDALLFLDKYANNL